MLIHLIISDLIQYGVKYGTNEKSRSLLNTIDKIKNGETKSLENRYTGVTAGGDSPMSQKGSVGHADKTEWGVSTAKTSPTSNRHFDKTVSLLCQWFVFKFESQKYHLKACRPSDISLQEKAPGNYNKQIEIMQKEVEEKLKGFTGKSRVARLGRTQTKDAGEKQQREYKENRDAAKATVEATLKALLQDRVKVALGDAVPAQ